MERSRPGCAQKNLNGAWPPSAALQDLYTFIDSFVSLAPFAVKANQVL